MSVCFYLVLAMCLVQFSVIMKLLFNLNEEKTLLHTCVSEKITIATVEVPKQFLDLTTVATIVTQPNEIIDGVAITLMLHAPTWFQRRYTMMIQNTLNNIPPTWKVQIFKTGKGQSKAGIEINPGLKRLIESGRVITTELPESLWKIKRYQLMAHPWLWEHALADKVLVFGGGSVLCSNSPHRLTDFIEYDYIGAPWGFKKGVGGDGSISIRSRKVMLSAINFELAKITDPNKKEDAYKSWGQEDQFFVSRLLEMKKEGISHIKIASKEDTYKFAAINKFVNHTVLAATGILDGAEHDDRDKFLTFCPELKMVYPSLHNPSCFGASPNAQGCANSICALREMVGQPRRKGGC